jgi:hypothetical protein
MSTPTTAAAITPQVSAALDFGGRIELALVNGWNAVEAEGKQVLVEIEDAGEEALTLVENTIAAVWSKAAPAVVTWLKTAAQTALTELGKGASIDSIVSSVFSAASAAGLLSQLEAIGSSGVTALVASLIAAL